MEAENLLAPFLQQFPNVRLELQVHVSAMVLLMALMLKSVFSPFLPRGPSCCFIMPG